MHRNGSATVVAKNAHKNKAFQTFSTHYQLQIKGHPQHYLYV